MECIRKSDKILICDPDNHYHILEYGNRVIQEIFSEMKVGEKLLTHYSVPKVGDKVRPMKLKILKLLKLLEAKSIYNRKTGASSTPIPLCQAMINFAENSSLSTVKHVHSDGRVVLEGSGFLWEPYWLYVIDQTEEIASTSKVMSKFYEFKTGQLESITPNPISISSDLVSKYKDHTHSLVYYSNGYTIYHNRDFRLKEFDTAKVIMTFCMPEKGDIVEFRGFNKLKDILIYKNDLHYYDVTHIHFNKDMIKTVQKNPIFSAVDMNECFSCGLLKLRNNTWNWRPFWFEVLK